MVLGWVVRRTHVGRRPALISRCSWWGFSWFGCCCSSFFFSPIRTFSDHILQKRKVWVLTQTFAPSTHFLFVWVIPTKISLYPQIVFSSSGAVVGCNSLGCSKMTVMHSQVWRATPGCTADNYDQVGDDALPLLRPDQPALNLFLINKWSILFEFLLNLTDMLFSVIWSLVLRCLLF